MTWNAKAAAWGLAGLLIFAAGLTTGWMLWRPKAQKAETYAREVRQQDGSLVLERKPQADAKPAQVIPKGAKVERVVQVTVQPTTPPQSLGPSVGPQGGTSGSSPVELEAPAAATSPPVRVDLTLVRMPDLTRRVVASSPDGQVVGGVDIPVETADRPRLLRWAAGGVYGVTSGGGRSVGAFLHRDFAFVRAGVEVTRDTPAGLASQWTGRAMVGIRF